MLSLIQRQGKAAAIIERKKRTSMKKLGKLLTLGGIIGFIATFAIVAWRQDQAYSAILGRGGTMQFNGFVRFVHSNQNAIAVITIAMIVVGAIMWITHRHDD